MSTQHFSAVVEAIRATLGAGGAQAVQISGLTQAVAFRTPPGLDDVVVTLSSALGSITQQQSEHFASARAALDSGDSNAFRQRMAQARDQAIAQMHAALDQAYQQLDHIGASYPEAQPAIAVALHQVSAIAEQANSSINAAFDKASDLANTVASGAQTAVDAAYKTLLGVGGEVTGVFDGAGSALKTVFSGW